MKSLTTDQASLTLIRAYDHWKAEDEQILAFLMELHSRRRYAHTIQTILSQSENEIQIV